MKTEVILGLLALAVQSFTVPLTLVQSAPESREALPVTQESLKEYLGNVTRALENRSNVSCTQMQYRGTLYIGTPPKAFTLIFDTGSSWLWVTNSTCGKSCHRVTNAYDQRNSSTYESRDFRITLEYGMGTAVGTVGKETVWLTPDISVKKQTFAVVYRNSGFHGMKADGLLVLPTQGLGFSSLADHNLTFIDNLYLQGYISAPLFAIYLSDNDFGRKHEFNFTSAVTFGFWDLKKYSQSDHLTYLPVYSNTGYWAVPLKSVHLGNQTVAGTSFIGIIDTGTSLLIGPSEEVDAILSYFISRWTCHAKGSLIDCICGSDLSELPDLLFVLGNDGYVFTIKPERYLIHRNDSCLLLFDSLQDNGLWILGDVFLRSYYAVFDMQNSRIGLAPSINNKMDAGIYQPVEDTFWTVVGIVMVFALGGLILWALCKFPHLLRCSNCPSSPAPSQRLLDS